MMRRLFGQFMRFCITGIFSAGIDFVVYLGLTSSIEFWSNHLVMATSVAFVTANINSYMMNKYWTFADKVSRHVNQYAKFIAVSLVGLSINTILFYFLVHVISINDIVSKIIVAIIVLFWNFIFHRVWTFAVT